MTTSAEKRSRQRKLFSILFGAIVIGGMILYLGVFKDPILYLPDDEIARRDKRLSMPILNKEILQDVSFISLSPYERLSRNIETGRENPFLPY